MLIIESTKFLDLLIFDDFKEIGINCYWNKLEKKFIPTELNNFRLGLLKVYRNQWYLIPYNIKAGEDNKYKTLRIIIRLYPNSTLGGIIIKFFKRHLE